MQSQNRSYGRGEIAVVLGPQWFMYKHWAESIGTGEELLSAEQTCSEIGTNSGFEGFLGLRSATT